PAVVTEPSFPIHPPDHGSVLEANTRRWGQVRICAPCENGIQRVCSIRACDEEVHSGGSIECRQRQRETRERVRWRPGSDDPAWFLPHRRAAEKEGGRVSVTSEPKQYQIEPWPIVRKMVPQRRFIIAGRQVCGSE